MLRNLVSTTNRFYEDQALIFMTFGGFGRYVLSLLREEFERLGIPQEKLSFLAFDTERPHRDNLDLERESDYFVPLDEFDGDVYVDNKENEQLKEAVSHIPVNLLRDIEGGCKGVPGVGFVAFHKYDDLLITRQALRMIDDVKAKNPGKRIKLIAISGMGGSVSNGMTVPFLYRIRDRLREKKIRVEVYLATSEGHLGLQNVQEWGVKRNCVASAMLWEYVMAGGDGIRYPGKNGFRDQRMFGGKIAHRMYVFSGGSAETSLKYQAIASTIAMCIATLELTKVGSYLDGDRVNYSAHILEREWTGKEGKSHPTGLLTMNTAGLKGDCLPQLFHLHAVKRFIEELTKPIDRQERDKVKGSAISTFLENSLNEDEILNQFKVETPALEPSMINEARLSEERIYPFLKEKIEELQDSAVEGFEKLKKTDQLSGFIEDVIESFTEKGNEILLHPDSYVTGGLVFYEKLGSLVDDKIKKVNGSISVVERELIEGTNQNALTTLLEKLESVTSKKHSVGDFVAKMGQSTTVTLINQIIETASKIQQQKKEKYNHLLLQHVYSSLARFLQDQQDHIKGSIYQCNKAISVIEGVAERITRVGRSAFTYNKSKFEDLTEHLMEKMYSKLELLSAPQVVAELGSPLPEKNSLDEAAYLERLLGIIRPDLDKITKIVDDIFCEDGKVYDYLKMTLDQFFMTLKLDRDRFPTLETSQCMFVMCTRKFYEKHRDDLFEGYGFIETQNPFNIIVTKHEEGFPFIAMSYFHRLNEEYKERLGHGEGAMGHIMADLQDRLPLLDS